MRRVLFDIILKTATSARTVLRCDTDSITLKHLESDDLSDIFNNAIFTWKTEYSNITQVENYKRQSHIFHFENNRQIVVTAGLQLNCYDRQKLLHYTL